VVALLEFGCVALDALVVAVELVASLASQALVEFVQVGAVSVSLAWCRVGGRRSSLALAGGVHDAAHGLAGHSALSDLNVEVAVQTPAAAPRVLDDPVVAGGVVAPSHDLDCVSASLLAGSLLVHSG